MLNINFNNLLILNNTQSCPFEFNNIFKKNEIPQDKFIKSRDKNVSFTGLSRILGKQALSLREILKLIEKYPKAKGRIGSIPVEWVIKIPENERGTKIPELYEGLGQIAATLRYAGQVGESVTKAEKDINSLFHRIGLLSEEQKIKLSKIENRTYGTGYQLGIEGDPNQYAIKIFRDKYAYLSHGNQIEASRAMFLRKNTENINAGNGDKANKSQFSRFHFDDAHNGYMLSQYIGDNKLPPAKKVDPILLGLYSVDSFLSHNMKRGYSFDYGAFQIIFRLRAKSKIVRWIFKKILKTPQNERTRLWYSIYLNKAQSNYNDIVIGLAESISLLIEEDQIDCFKAIARNADKNIKEALAPQLRILPESERGEYFRAFCENANKNIKLILSRKLHCLPVTEMTKCFKAVAEESDNDIKVILARQLELVPLEDRAECFVILAKNANNDVKEILDCKLNFLPEVDVAKCKDAII